MVKYVVSIYTTGAWITVIPDDRLLAVKTAEDYTRKNIVATAVRGYDTETGEDVYKTACLLDNDGIYFRTTVLPKGRRSNK